ncbi:retinol dehydrogenase 7-like [Hyla sarda]|uniref:retinol dehydrogenase 7-like n=1 Tax=Hyla sarda TaxID=327740 RepID=UPI0024C27FF6|nr:retinol dehydrogenase 7-like [Hyla sarda]
MWLFGLVLLGLSILYRWYRQSQVLENLSDKYVFITGCDTGFGNLLAKQLDKRGMKVLASFLTEKGAENLKKETSSRLQTIILDVTDSKSVRFATKWVSTIVKDKGLWGLVNNAGIGIPGGINEWLTTDDFVKILKVNLLGVIDVTINMLPMIRKAQGRIVNVSSVAGRLSICGGGYCISKHGIESFSDSLRREMLPFGVKVTIIEPGFFKTELTNPQLQKESIKRTWEQASEEVKESYGAEFFMKSYGYMDSVESFCSTKLSLATDCMEHALTAVHPWTRYSAGWDTKLILIPLSYMPTVITDYLLTKGQPKPAQKVSFSAK